MTPETGIGQATEAESFDPEKLSQMGGSGWKEGTNKVSLPVKEWQRFKNDDKKWRVRIVVPEGNFILSPTKADELYALQKKGVKQAIVIATGSGMQRRYQVIPAE